jgi:ferric-dicitrate binding protein FerR (iron transport regulator)
MTEKKAEKVQRLTAKKAQLQKQLDAINRPIKARERKQKADAIAVFGLLVLKMLQAGAVEPDQLKADCERYLTAKGKRDKALTAIADFMPPVQK